MAFKIQTKITKAADDLPVSFVCLLHCPVSECCGALEYYDKAFDRITTRSEKPLRSIKRIFHTVTTTDDPVIRKVGTLKECCWLLQLRLQKEQHTGTSMDHGTSETLLDKMLPNGTGLDGNTGTLLATP